MPEDENMALWLEQPARVNVANERIEVTRDRLWHRTGYTAIKWRLKSGFRKATAHR